MALEVKVPTVGESISEVTLSRWLKKDGDYVEMDEVICELESDKATFELNAEAAGVLKTMGQEGDTIAVGAVICTIDTSAEPKAKKESPEKEKTDSKAPEADSGEKRAYASGTPSPAAQKILSE